MTATSLATVLVVDDDSGFRDSVGDFLEDLGLPVALASTRAEALAVSERRRVDIVLLDQKLPDGSGVGICAELMHRHDHAKIVLMTAYPGVETVVEALRAGAFDYLTKPVSLEAIRFAVNKAAKALRLEAAEQRLEFAEQQEREQLVLVGSTGGLRATKELADSASHTRAPVLITGETGTGKSMLARHIHVLGHRGNAPFVAVNAGALPATLLESELFGHERGAFTGADKTRRGVFELAHGGTLFLDELGALTLESQSKLLSVLDAGEVRRIGSEQLHRVSVRVIAATNTDLETAVAQGVFRQDLFYRLNVIRIRMPALRERIQDLPDLCRYFVSTLQPGRPFRELPAEELARLTRYDWPGNIRELRNVLERALAFGDGRSPSEFLERRRDPEATPPQHLSQPWERPLDEVEREHVLRVYSHVGGNVSAAARVLRIAETTLRRKLRRYAVGQATLPQ